MNVKQVDICVGAGGVGKTTVASVLGLHYALKGEKVLVITIDPARRLLDALGLERPGFNPKEVDLSRFSTKNGGSLFALMPDLKREWMDFLNSSIKKSEVRHEISSNPFYQYMAEGLPGAFEIICSHVLYRLMESNKFDRIILDTPPSSHSLSFFDVPKKISSVLEQGIFRALMKKRGSILLKLTKKLVFFSGGLMEKTLERLIGSHFLSEVIDFALTIDSLYEPMLKRAVAMDELLKSKNTNYTLVLRPTATSVSDSIYLYESLQKRGVKISKAVINQVSPQYCLKAIDNELIAMKLAGQEQAISVIEMYKDEVLMQTELIKKLKRFLNVDTQKLFVSDEIERSKLLKNLLADFEGL